MIVREVSFEKESASIDAIQRASYRLSDRLSIDLSSTEAIYRCVLAIDVEAEEDADRAVADLRNEVVDQVLRSRVRAETEEVRNLILSLAFSRTGLTASEQD